MFGLVLFGLVSAGLLAVSWQSLKNPGSHGFYRFFAWEAILGLLLLNAPHWFAEPFSARQLLSWILLLASAVLAVHGFRLLKRIGQPRGSFENTSQLVTSGAYHYIRHPLYASLLYLAWGAFFKNISLLSSLLALLATTLLTATARVEEAENLQKFGMQYQAYIHRTKRFIPFIF